MQEPLFMQPVLQEKMWGGTKLRDIYGYDIPSNRTGECWAISAHRDGVGSVENGSFAGMKLDDLYTQHPELFDHPFFCCFSFADENYRCEGCSIGASASGR